MEWSIYNKPHNKVVRCVDTEDGYLIRVLKKESQIARRSADSMVELADITNDLLDECFLSDSTLQLSESVPEFVREKIRLSNRRDMTDLDVNNCMFEEFDTLSNSEKIFLESQYKDRIELPDMVSATNRFTSIFVSAGFATALVAYDITSSIILGFLSVSLVLSGLVFIRESRTKITDQNSPEVNCIIESVAKNLEHIDEADAYVVKSFVSSPFTLPVGDPSVYIPIDLIENLTDSELRAIVQHELGHHKSGANSVIVMLVSISSSILIAPMINIFTGLQSGVLMFIILVVYTSLSQFLALFIGRKDEVIADQQVENPDGLVKSLIRLSPSVYHVDNGIQSSVHRLFDVHPPMNKRIENMYTDRELQYDNISPWSRFVWLGVILVVSGSIMVGYGFLTFANPSIPEEYIFSGSVIMIVGMIPQYYVNKGKLDAIKLTVIMVVSFGFTIGFGFYLGADSVVGAVAQGRMGRRVFFMGAFLLIGVLFLLSSIYKDYSPESSNIPSLADDWYEDIQDEN